MTYLLLLIIYIGFIGLGLPDSLFGAAWPASVAIEMTCGAWGSTYLVEALGLTVGETAGLIMFSMIKYDCSDVPPIQHFEKVHNFAATIGVAESIDDWTLVDDIEMQGNTLTHII